MLESVDFGWTCRYSCPLVAIETINLLCWLNINRLFLSLRDVGSNCSGKQSMHHIPAWLGKPACQAKLFCLLVRQASRQRLSSQAARQWLVYLLAGHHASVMIRMIEAVSSPPSSPSSGSKYSIWLANFVLTMATEICLQFAT